MDRDALGRNLLAVGLAALIATATAKAQFSTSNQFTLSDAQVDAVDSTVQGELASIEALLADEHWDEAVGRLRALAEQPDERVVLADADAGLYISLRCWCQRLICRLPPPALALYRARVDGLAEGWYAEGIADRDEALLERIVEQVFASSVGDNALFALGEIALARGDYSGARRAWERITPLARSPDGRPLWIALAGIDIRAKWDEVEPLLADRTLPLKGLFYPDTDLDVAQVLARLVLVSIREGSFDRAETELSVLEGLFPAAIGRLGGKDVVLAESLRDLLVEAASWAEKSHADDWTTFAGAPHRNGVAERVPESVSHVVWRASWERDEGGRNRHPPQRSAEESRGPLSVHPVLVGNSLLYGDRNRIYTLNLVNGKPAVEGRDDGVLYLPQREPSQADLRPGRGRVGVPRYTLTVEGGDVFARTGSPLTSRADDARLIGDEGIVGLELDGGRLQWNVEPPTDRWAFDGTPLVVGDRVLVAMRQSDVRPRAVVACYSRTTGGILWQTFVASADTPARSGWEEVSHNLLTLAGDTIYFNTNLGVIASLDVRSGQIRWIKRYDRAREGDLTRLADHFDRDLTPCLYHRGVVYCAPSDTPFLFALDAVTGETIWANNEAGEVVHLLGVVGNRLIASGDQLWWLDAVSGKVKARWPEGPGAGLHGYGRGVIAGDAVLWPTREQRVFVFDVFTALPKREPIDLRPLDVTAGNLLVAGKLLVIADADEIAALGPKPARGNESEEAEVALLD